MKNQIRTILFFLIIIIGLIFIFFPNWLVLDFPLKKNVPLGTIISWIGIAVYALLFYLIFQKKSFIKIIPKLLFFNLLLSVFWGLISFLLSGNWSFNFKGGNFMLVWKIYTGFILIIPIVIVLFSAIFWIYKLIVKR